MSPTQAVPGQQNPQKSFREQYEADPTFRAQIDESRLRRQRQQTTGAIKTALATASGLPGSKPKMY